MKRYLIDSTVLAPYLPGRRAAAELISPWILNHEAATSILVYGEIIEYLIGRPDFRRHRDQLRLLLPEVSPYFLTYAILEHYANIRRLTRPPEGDGLIGDVEALIAASALERDLTVVTTDSHFERVPGL